MSRDICQAIIGTAGTLGHDLNQDQAYEVYKTMGHDFRFADNPEYSSATKVLKANPSLFADAVRVAIEALAQLEWSYEALIAEIEGPRTIH